MTEVKYPRRQLPRMMIKFLIKMAFQSLTDLEITGEENIPDQGPVIIAGNHFSYADAVAMIHIAPPPSKCFPAPIPPLLPVGRSFFPVYGGCSMFTGGLLPGTPSGLRSPCSSRTVFLVFFLRGEPGQRCCVLLVPGQLI